MKYIVLDSAPLSLVTRRDNSPGVKESLEWIEAKATAGIYVVVPEIIDYELRRELIRAGKTGSIKKLDAFIAEPNVQYLPITTAAMRLAAALWAKLRQQGLPTADWHALDADVIMAAQVLSAGYATGEFIVATSNVAHITRLIPADLWTNI